MLAASSPVAAAAPTQSQPLPALELDAGSTTEGALDLSLYFTGGVGPLRFSPVPGPAPPGGGTGVELRVRGALLDVVAPDTAWTGSRSFQVEACSADAGPANCTLSNTFEVTVNPPPFGRPDVNPVGYSVSGAEVLGSSTQGERPTVTLESDGGAVVRTTPVWSLDGEPIGEGNTVTLPPLSPGTHLLEVRFEGTDGPVVIRRAFGTAPLPPAPPATPVGLAAGATLSIAVGAAFAGSARLRRPLVFLLVGLAYPRLRRESLLDHFNRGALHQVIKENPGIHFAELRRRTGIAHGTAIHHLRALEQGGYVTAVATGAFTRYYGTGAKLDPRLYGLSPSEHQLLNAVKASPGIGVGDLAARLGRSEGATSRAVTRLDRLGFLTTQREHRRRLIFARPEGPATERLPGREA